MENLLKNKFNALLFSDEIQRKYFSFVNVAEGHLVLIQNEKYYFIDDRYYYAVEGIIKEKGIIPIKYTGKDCIKAFLKEKNIKNLYINFESVVVSDYLQFLKSGFNVKDCSREVQNVRSVKSDYEINSIKKACEIAQKAFYNIIHDIKIGDTENQVKEKLENEMIKLGAEGGSFPLIVAFNSNSAIPHHETDDTKLTNDSVILIDFGCKVNGYCSDITRTFVFGKPSEKFLLCYNAVLEANLKAESEIFDGISVFDADSIARNALKVYNLDKNFTHSLGHGVGLEIHEYPYLSPKRKGQLVENNVFTVEPGVYFNGEFGIRIEDTCLMKNGKAVRLFTDDKKLIILK